MATKGTFEIIKEWLSLNNPVVIGVSPNTPNIFLSVAPPLKLPSFAESIADQLKKMLTFPKTVIFCQNYEDCANMYKVIVHTLGKEKTEPPGYPNLLEYRLITMCTRASTSVMKEIIMSLFSDTESKLQILITTTAFSIGIDFQIFINYITLGYPPILNNTYKKSAGLVEMGSHLVLC